MVSIILPVHNQANHIAATVQLYHAELEPLASRNGFAYEIILVVNACTDQSAQVCEDLSTRLPMVRTIQSAVGGWGLAVRLGLAEARGDLLLYANSARTTAPELSAVLQMPRLANPRSVIKAMRPAWAACDPWGPGFITWNAAFSWAFPGGT